MKTIISIALIGLMAFSCKKSTTKPVEPTPSTTGGNPVTVIDSTQYTITVTSNYLRSYVGVDNLTDTKEIKRFNVQGNDVSCPITYSFWVRSDKHFYVNTYSTKNSSDSTLFMSDNGHVWNKLVVYKGTTLVYSKKDSIGSGAWPITVNNYHINQ